MAVLRCPACGAAADNLEARFCSACGAALADGRSAPPADTHEAESAKAPPPAWEAYADPWTGITLERPAGWEAHTVNGATTIARDPEGRVAASLLMLPMTQPATAEEVARRFIGASRVVVPSFMAWQLPVAEGETSNTTRLTLRTQADLNGPVDGVIFVETRDGAAVIRGFQAPSSELAGLRPVFERILASVRTIEALPRTRFVEANEGALTGYVPHGWQAAARLTRGPGGLPLFELRAADPAGSAMLAMPPGVQQYAATPAAGQMAPYRPLMPAVHYIDQALGGEIRRQHPGAAVEPAVSHPDLARLHTILETEANAPLPVLCDVASVRYTSVERGTPTRTRTFAKLTVTPALGLWSAQVWAVLRARAEEFAAREPVLLGVLHSIRPDPQWLARERQRARMALAQAQQRVAFAQQALLQSQQHLFQTRMGIAQDAIRHTERRMAMSERQVHSFDNVLRGTQDMYDPATGRVFNVDLAGYGQYWANALDQVYLGDFLSGPPQTGMHRLEPLDP